MLLSALAHGALGWPSVAGALEDAAAPADLIGGVAAGWQFGTLAMVIFGALVLLGGWRLRRDDVSMVTPLRIVAAGYVLFGAAALVALGPSPPLLSFLVVGVLAGTPTWGVAPPRS